MADKHDLDSLLARWKKLGEAGRVRFATRSRLQMHHLDRMMRDAESQDGMARARAGKSKVVNKRKLKAGSKVEQEVAELIESQEALDA